MGGGRVCEGRVGGWLEEVIPPPGKHSIDFEARTECCIFGALIGAGRTSSFQEREGVHTSMVYILCDVLAPRQMCGRRGSFRAIGCCLCVQATSYIYSRS